MTEYGEQLVKYKALGKLIKRDQFRKLWHLGYYDGPLSGIGIYGDKFCAFDMVFEAERWPCPRIYAVYELTLDEFKEELFHHELFRMYVGFHTDYHFGKRWLGVLHSESEREKFYKIIQNKYPRQKMGYTKREPIVYFR